MLVHSVTSLTASNNLFTVSIECRPVICACTIYLYTFTKWNTFLHKVHLMIMKGKLSVMGRSLTPPHATSSSSLHCNLNSWMLFHGLFQQANSIEGLRLLFECCVLCLLQCSKNSWPNTNWSFRSLSFGLWSQDFGIRILGLGLWISYIQKPIIPVMFIISVIHCIFKNLQNKSPQQKKQIENSTHH